jgi:hypothetical protein
MKLAASLRQIEYRYVPRASRCENPTPYRNLVTCRSTIFDGAGWWRLRNYWRRRWYCGDRRYRRVNQPVRFGCFGWFGFRIGSFPEELPHGSTNLGWRPQVNRGFSTQPAGPDGAPFGYEEQIIVTHRQSVRAACSMVKVDPGGMQVSNRPWPREIRWIEADWHFQRT